jgi:hypothetical protein
MRCCVRVRFLPPWSSKHQWKARLALYERPRLRAQLLDILRAACSQTVPDMPDAIETKCIAQSKEMRHEVG